MKILYTAEATAAQGRTGHAETSDGSLKFKLARPKDLGGDGDGANPEQLFACGYAACFGSAIDFVARQQKKPIADIRVTARVSLGRDDDGRFGLAAELTVRLPGLPAADAEAIVAAAHQTCPYSNATRGNIPVTLRVET